MDWNGAQLRDRRILIPAILVTSLANEDLRSRATPAGASIVEKPLLASRLFDSILELFLQSCHYNIIIIRRFILVRPATNSSGNAKSSVRPGRSRILFLLYAVEIIDKRKDALSNNDLGIRHLEP